MAQLEMEAPPQKYFCGLRILPFDAIARQIYDDLRSQKLRQESSICE